MSIAEPQQHNLAKPQHLALRSLGDIAASLPGSTAIFRRHKLDFCCGGSESLERAARKNASIPRQLRPSSRTYRRHRIPSPIA
jgi:iron-sulfur cluster repair protein YtfE (RIC family)